MLHNISQTPHQVRLTGMLISNNTTQIRAAVSEWINSITASQNISAKEIARRAKISPQTIYRLLGHDDSYHHAPSVTTIMKIAAATGTRPPAILELDIPGLREDDAAPLLPPNGKETTETNTPNETTWTMRNSTMRTAGILEGDHFIVDAEALPGKGDIVMAQIYNFEAGTAQTVIRIYQPPALLPADPMARDSEVFPVNDSAVRIAGVLTKIWRYRVTG